MLSVYMTITLYIRIDRAFPMLLGYTLNIYDDYIMYTFYNTKFKNTVHGFNQ